MPFLGLVDKRGEEIVARGYHRLDMSYFSFKISPPDDASVHFIFINSSMIIWPPAKEPWSDVSGCCVFAEVDDEKPAIIRMFADPKPVLVGETIGMSPGQLRIDSTVTPNERRNFKRQQRCPNCGAEIEQ